MGWKSKEEAKSSSKDPGQADATREERTMLSEGWKISRKSSSSPHDTGPAVVREDMYAAKWTGKKHKKTTPLWVQEKTYFRLV